MQWKHSFHALSVRNPAHSERFIQTAALTTDHDARKDLYPLLVTFHNTSVYTHAVANGKQRDIAFLLLFLNNINDLVHTLLASRVAAGAHFPSNRTLLQPEIVLLESTTSTTMSTSSGRNYL